MRLLLLLLCFILVLFLLPSNGEVEFDRNGYVMYCPCMGRFGNQADHFLGSLSFAKKLNRTLIVPPWITHDYRSMKYGNDFVPYSEWFRLDTLLEYHRVIGMAEFMKTIAPTLWPKNERKVYCHQAAMDRSNDGRSCPAKNGNPFGPFWNHLNVDFSSSEAFPTRLSYHSARHQWDETYPVSKNPVLAFMGAPAPYPVRKSDRHLQKLMEWSPKVQEYADDFISTSIKRPYLGVHLRNGVDWKRACDHVGESVDYAYMSSPQCVGYNRPTKPFTREMCFPSSSTIKKQVIEAVRKIGANTLFVATDADNMKSQFKKWFAEASLKVNVAVVDHDALISDLAILIEADDFIGSCASSVTAFAVRKRDTLKRPSSFFGDFSTESRALRSEL